MHSSGLILVLCLAIEGILGAPATNFPPAGLLQEADQEPSSTGSSAGIPLEGESVAEDVLRKKRNKKRGSKSSPTSSRAPMPPGLADLLKKAYSNPGLKGDILYTARKHCDVHFSLDNYRHLEPTDVVMAQLHLRQITPKRPLRDPKGQGQPGVTQARVSVHEVTQKGKRLTSITRVLDSKLVPANGGGWLALDITTAIQSWLRQPSSNKGLEVWVESTAPGSRAARVARKVRFVKPNGHNLKHRPALVMYFKRKDHGF